MTGCPGIVSVQVETGVAVGARTNLGENDINRESNDDNCRDELYNAKHDGTGNEPP